MIILLIEKKLENDFLFLEIIIDLKELLKIIWNMEKWIIYYNQNNKIFKEIWIMEFYFLLKLLIQMMMNKINILLKNFSKQNSITLGFFYIIWIILAFMEVKKNKNFTLFVIRFFKARIPNNYLDLWI